MDELREIIKREWKVEFSFISTTGEYYMQIKKKYRYLDVTLSDIDYCLDDLIGNLLNKAIDFDNKNQITSWMNNPTYKE